MKEDIMMQDEEQTLILEKERGNVRTFFQLINVSHRNSR